MEHDGYSEPVEELSEATRDMHRAITSLVGQLQAVDRYNQRVDACRDDELRALLAQKRDAAVGDAAMTLEWLRRRHVVFYAGLREFLFTDGPSAQG